MNKSNENSSIGESLTARQVRQTTSVKGKKSEVTLQRKGPKLRRTRKPGDVTALQRRLWQAVLASEDLLLSENATLDEQLRAIHALTQAGTTYGKLLETADLQTQLDALREEIRELKQAQGLRKVV